MIKHVLTLIWNQRRSNGWIFAELLLVVCASWFVADRVWVDLRCFYSPLGYDIQNTWRFKLSDRVSNTSLVTGDSLRHSDSLHDLQILIDRLRRELWVENVCLTYWSQPYCYGGSRYSLYAVDSDSTALSGKIFHVLRVSPEYFSLFKVCDVEGRDVESAFRSYPQSMVLTRKSEREIFGDESAVGRQLSFTPELTEVYDIVSVVPFFRSHDFERQEDCVFILLQGEELAWAVNWFGVENAEISVRTKQPLERVELYRRMEEMGERLQVNDLSVYGVTKLSDQRDILLRSNVNANKKSFSLFLFLSMNVFLGVIGSFWLRTERRRGEIGLRGALGASRKRLKRELYSEGLCLLALTFPFVLVFVANVLWLGKLDTYREAYSCLRLFVTLGGTYLLVMCLICIGIWYPVRKAVGMVPAEALHYE